MIRRFCWAALPLLVALTACSSLVDPAQPQPSEETVGELTANHRIGQTFVAHHHGLCGVDILVATYGRVNTESVIFHLRQSPQSDVDLRTVTISAANLADKEFFPFSFDPIHNSKGQRLFFFLDSPSSEPGNAITAWRGAPASYANGALYLDSAAQEGQLTFRLHYSYPQMALGLASDLVRGLPVALASLALFVLPGLALLVWLLPSKPPDVLATVITATGLSVAIAPLVLLASRLAGWRWGPVSTWIALVVCVVLVAWRWRNRGPYTWHIKVSFDGLLLLGVLASILAVRLLVIQSYSVPLWGDSVQHTVIVQMFLDRGGLTDSWLPYAPFNSLTVHYGFHAMTAFFQWATRLSTPLSVLMVGQLLNALAALTLYPLAVRISNGRRWAGVLAVLIAGMLAPTPMVYVNWGRYPQLAGQVILPVALWLLWELAASRRRRAWRLALLTALAAAGMALTYYRMPYYYAAFLPAWLVGYILPRYRLHKDDFARLLGRLALAGVFASIALAAWIPCLLRGHLGQVIMSHTGVTTPLDTVLEQYRAWLRPDVVEEHIPRYLLALVPVTMVWSLARRRWSAVIVGGWLVTLLGLFAARLTPLPGAGNLDLFAILIALYIPVALLVGWLGCDLLDLLKHRRQRLAQAALAGLCLAGVVWGGIQQLGRFDPSFGLVTHADLLAMDWIRGHTQPEARFLVNGFRIYDGRSVVGSDAGWWIPLLAGRQNTVPPQYAILNELPIDPDYVEQTVDLIAQLEQTPPTTPEGIRLLCGRGITHAYIGQRHGRVAQQDVTPYLVPAELLDSQAFELRYHEDRVWVFALTAGVCDQAIGN